MPVSPSPMTSPPPTPREDAVPPSNLTSRVFSTISTTTALSKPSDAQAFPQTYVRSSPSFSTGLSNSASMHSPQTHLKSQLGPHRVPLSPVLSIYTADLLHQVNEWPDSCLLMFIDDGNILSSGPSYRVVMAMLSNWYRECLLWLQRSVSQSRARGLKLSSTVCTNLGPTQMAQTPPMRYLTLLCDTHLLPHSHTFMSQNLNRPCHVPAVTLQTLISTTI